MKARDAHILFTFQHAQEGEKEACPVQPLHFYLRGISHSSVPGSLGLISTICIPGTYILAHVHIYFVLFCFSFLVGHTLVVLRADSWLPGITPNDAQGNHMWCRGTNLCQPSERLAY